MGEPLSESEPKQPGVIGHRQENGFYIVDICWADGNSGAIHFPVNGFDVVNPETHKRLFHLNGPEALAVLQSQVGQLTRQEFSWDKFPPKK